MKGEKRGGVAGDAPGSVQDRPAQDRPAQNGPARAGAVEAPVRLGFDTVPRGPLPATVEVRRGGCLCGAVRYEARGAPRLVGLCHCGDCRKATGGFAMPYADWPLGAVTVTGRLSTWGGRSFCPECGSRVVHLNAHHAEIILGTLDEAPFDLIPTREIWTLRRQPWAAAVPGAAQFERDAG